MFVLPLICLLVKVDATQDSSLLVSRSAAASKKKKEGESSGSAAAAAAPAAAAAGGAAAAASGSAPGAVSLEELLSPSTTALSPYLKFGTGPAPHWKHALLQSRPVALACSRDGSSFILGRLATSFLPLFSLSGRLRQLPHVLPRAHESVQGGRGKAHGAAGACANPAAAGPQSQPQMFRQCSTNHP